MLSANVTNQQRKAIYRRDGYRCALCDSTRYLQIHHVIPRGKGGTDSPHNLITLCSDCHALAHGTNLRDWQDVTQEDIEHAIVEYLADYYAGEGYLWSPWAKDPEDPSLNLLDHRNHPMYRDDLPLTRAEKIAWEQLQKGGDYPPPFLPGPSLEVSRRSVRLPGLKVDSKVPARSVPPYGVPRAPVAIEIRAKGRREFCARQRAAGLPPSAPPPGVLWPPFGPFSVRGSPGPGTWCL